jgi:hypothetical protein
MPFVNLGGKTNFHAPLFTNSFSFTKSLKISTWLILPNGNKHPATARV